MSRADAYRHGAPSISIGAVLISPVSYYGLASFLRAEDFFLVRHQYIWQAFQRLADRTQPADEDLPDTGVGLVWERLLGTAFIRSPLYGTRASSLLWLGRTRARLFERGWLADGQGEDNDFAFNLDDRTD